MPDIEAVLSQAYHAWTKTGFADVPEFNPADYDPDALKARLAGLEAVEKQCVISRTGAQFLRRVTS